MSTYPRESFRLFSFGHISPYTNRSHERRQKGPTDEGRPGTVVEVWVRSAQCEKVLYYVSRSASDGTLLRIRWAAEG